MGNVSVSVVSGNRNVFERFHGDWNALCDEGPCSWLTYRPDWVDCFLAAYHPKDRCHAVIFRRDGEIRGILPLVETRFGWGPFALRRVRLAANFFSWEFDLIHGNGDRDEIIAAAVDFLDHWRDWDVFVCAAALDSAAFPLIAKSLQSRGASAIPPAPMTGWIIPCPPAGSTFEETVELIAKQRQRQLRRHLKKANSLGVLEWTCLTPDDPMDDLLAGFDDLVQLEASGWKGRTGAPVIRDAPLLDFELNLIRQRKVFVHRLKLDGKLLAANIGVKFGDRFFSIRIAYEEEFAHISPGHLMTMYTLVDMANRGCSAMDCAGTHAGVATYKTIWTDWSYPISSYMLFRKGLRGKTIHFAWTKLLPRVTTVVNRLRH